MSSNTYKVIVRGKFAPLTEEQRASLLARADEHDLFAARFTDEGTVTYERPLRIFTFRCLVPVTPDDSEAVVFGKAEEAATAAVRKLGADSSDLHSVSSDLEDMLRRRGR
ncbi:DUF6204 family protein [Micromonospora sp. NPDC002296]|uniref:DUF6204 family protein n=1 Tax=Micromonospora sp. NPDC002296 TaxID=3154271 RepID=UPI0033254F7E